MANYITPIIDRTQQDVDYARSHQSDLVNKNKGAWNYTDLNRICNNLLYAAEYMYNQGFLPTPYTAQIKTNWVESDIITIEQLNTMIVNNMNNLKTYSRPDLNWHYIASLVNIDYNVANWIEQNIHALATQEPISPDKYTLTVTNGTGSGEYEARTVVTIQASPAPEGQIFDHWSGDHLENIENATAAITHYTMPLQDVRLYANYTSATPHKLTIITHSGTEEVNLSMGQTKALVADPAPQSCVFHHWDVTPQRYENNLYEPAATTTFVMPNEAVTISAFYITKGPKHLTVQNGNGSGWYNYDQYVSVSSQKPANATFTYWTGDTQYLSGPVTQEYNSIRIPDVSQIIIRANWTVPPVTNVSLTVVNGVITSTGETTGTFTEGDQVAISSDPIQEGKVFTGWSKSGGGSVIDTNSMNTMAVIGTSDMTVTSTRRTLEYYTLTVTTNSGTSVTTKEIADYFSVSAYPEPSGYVFDHWSGDTTGLNIYQPITYTTMGSGNRTISAVYREIVSHTLVVHQPSGDVSYSLNEFDTITITADNPSAGQQFFNWTFTGSGSISNYNTQSTIYTFGNGNAELTPNYRNIWTISVTNGTINGSASAVLPQGELFRIQCRDLASNEGFTNWSQSGPGDIIGSSSPSTYFRVGAGDTSLTANITQYSNKTLTIYMRDPETEIDTLVSQQTYTYGSYIAIEAPVAPANTTFSTWLGDVSALSPSALASSVTINSITTDVTITATYFYPQTPEYYTLTVYDGYPESQSVAVGDQVTIRAKQASQGWEFYKWYGDTQYLVDSDLTQEENVIIMPSQPITLYAKFKVVGELPLWRVSVSNGTANAIYITDEGTEQEQIHEVSGTYIDIPEGITVTLTANADEVGWVFDYWSGNFIAAGVDDIDTTITPTTFTMVEADINTTVVRREQNKCIIYPTHATVPTGQVYPATYTISGNLVDTEDIHYIFSHWTCVDANEQSQIQKIANPNNETTTITLSEGDTLWVEAHYTNYYKLTVVEGQNTDTNPPYYYEDQVINTVYANTAPTGMQFDHWLDPVGVITTNIYDPTPTIKMKNSIATITAVFTSLSTQGNSVVVTGNDLHTGTIYRRNTTIINGMITVGTIVFDADGCIGMITVVDPDHSDDTDDFSVMKLFYGGNF